MQGSVLRHLASLPSFYKLELSLWSHTPLPTTLPTTCTFASLQWLALEVDSVQRVYPVLEIIKTPALAKLTLLILNGTNFSWEDLFRAIVTHFSEPPRFQTIEIELEEPDMGPYILTSPAFALLHPLHHLINIDLQSWMFFDLNDEALDEMATAWPGLEVLGLGRGAMPHEARVSVNGVVRLAQRCLRLHTLRLTIDGRIPLQLNEDWEIIQNRALYNLNLTDSCIDPTQIQEIASLFVKGFPSLTEIVTQAYDGDKESFGHFEGWRMVVFGMAELRK